MINDNDINNQNSNINMASKKLSLIIHNEEIQLLTRLINEIMEEEDSQDNTIEN